MHIIIVHMIYTVYNLDCFSLCVIFVEVTQELELSKPVNGIKSSVGDFEWQINRYGGLICIQVNE